MVFCLAKSFVPRVLIDFEIFQYQFAPNCNTERGATGAPCRWRRSLVCVHRARIFSPGSRTDGMPTIANSFFPPHPPRSPAPSSFSRLSLPSFSSRFIFRALIASSLCLPFSYWRHVISSSSSTAGLRRFGERHRRFF